MKAYIIANNQLIMTDKTFGDFPLIYSEMTDRNRYGEIVYEARHPLFVVLGLRDSKQTYEIYHGNLCYTILQLTTDFIFKMIVHDAEFVTFYSDEDTCFITQSLQYESVSTFGDTKEESEYNYHEVIKAATEYGLI